MEPPLIVRPAGRDKMGAGNRAYRLWGGTIGGGGPVIARDEDRRKADPSNEVHPIPMI